ncbi:MBL fold metallo-hydrolase [uncultured Draconibacterium sp.]|uniref:MBL fold metallo-hydrolase n=1 Tax=uncultured Draconibacterium sp. TaxID=1573823 RepID=UPI003217438C
MNFGKIHLLKINFEIPLSPQISIPRFVNMFVIEGNKLYLIDTGVKTAFDTLKSFTAEIGHDISAVQSVFLTHSHPDHIGAAKHIRNATNCTFYAPQAESNWVEDTEEQFRNRPVPGFHQLVAGSVKVNHKITAFQEIELEKGLTLKAIPTPGHSAGSTSYYLKEQNVLFCGDAILLPGEIPVFEDVKAYLNSLKTISKLKVATLYSAWDQPRKTNEIPDILQKSKAYILNIQKVAKNKEKEFKNPATMEFCQAVLEELGQNKALANPLLLKSFLACLIE